MKFTDLLSTDLEKAIDFLLDLTENKDKELHTQTVMQKAKFVELKAEMRNETIDSRDEKLTKARIRVNISGIYDDYEKKFGKIEISDHIGESFEPKPKMTYEDFTKKLLKLIAEAEYVEVFDELNALFDQNPSHEYSTVRQGIEYQLKQGFVPNHAQIQALQMFVKGKEVKKRLA